MDTSTFAWIWLIAFGFAFGLASGPMALLRIGLGLTMLSGLGVLLADTSGHDRLAWWFGIGVIALLAAFAVALLGAFVGAAVRKAFWRGPGNRRASLRTPRAIAQP